MSKLTKKQTLVDDVFKPNKEGVSDFVNVDVLCKVGLPWSNNGNGRHGIFFGDSRYVWESKRGKQRKVTHLRTIGFNEDWLLSSDRPIRKDIEKYHKAMGCVVCGSKSDLVTDHKNDLYNDIRVLNEVTQVKEDFQCLCNHCNLQKRQVCKKTKETKKRYSATSIPSLAPFKIDFISGDETFDESDINAMVGTYWYDPVAFMEYIYQKFEND